MMFSGLAASVPAAKLRAFVVESNRIEGIVRKPTVGELKTHEWFLAMDARALTVDALCEFVGQIAGATLRDEPGMNVFVGNHRPPPGGPAIRDHLAALLADVAHPYIASETTPYEAHVAYETLHPFMDGNGRSGRALWAWQMRNEGHDPFALPFLHRFYYQAFDGGRSA